ncbi:MAG: response regulator [Bacteroidales bacterium]|nr:response regulator [Bacteroidales bacterium]
MNKQNLNILNLEDNSDDAELIVRELKKEGFVFEWKRVETETSFKKALAEKPDIILSDYKLPSFDGMAAIKLQQQTAPDIPLILVSGTIGEELAVECVKAGATDYVLKDKISRLCPVIKRAIKEAEELRKRKQAEEELKKRLSELEIYYKATMGREERIIELKHDINRLLERLGENRKYGV